MTAISQLHFTAAPTTSLRRPNHRLSPLSPHLSFPNKPSPLPISLSLSSGHGSGRGPVSGGGHGSGGGGNDSNSNSNNSDDSEDSPAWWENLGIIGMLISGWRERVAADSQFPFKVLMEEVVGVTSCVIGDMASRPNFGLNELDFVFSTLIVGSILNFTLMYLLAPTLSSGASNILPGVFAGCPTSHMFQPGNYGLVPRLGTFVYKGIVFAGVGFAAGLVGTAISNGLILVRKKLDPEFETPNKAPPTLLNAVTWAAHMGLSSNFRYQTLNGVEFLLENVLPKAVFKSSVVVLRCANNVLGGMSFVVLARLTGSQNAGGGKTEEEGKAVVVSVTEETVGSNQST